MKVTTTHYRIGNVIQTVRVSSYEPSDLCEEAEEGKRVPKPDSQISKLPEPTSSVQEFPSRNAAKKHNRIELRCAARKAEKLVSWKLIEGSKHRHSRYKIVHIPAGAGS